MRLGNSGYSWDEARPYLFEQLQELGAYMNESATDSPSAAYLEKRAALLEAVYHFCCVWFDSESLLKHISQLLLLHVVDDTGEKHVREAAEIQLDQLDSWQQRTINCQAQIRSHEVDIRKVGFLHKSFLC